MVRALSLVGLAAVAVAACGGDDSDQAARTEANRVARAYLQAAERGNSSQLCTLRTQRVHRGWKGRTCQQVVTGLAADSGPRRENVEAAQSRILPSDTTVDGRRARVVVDFGKARTDDGHAVSGEVIELDLLRVDDTYRIDKVGRAAFAD